MSGILKLGSELRRRLLAYFFVNETEQPHVRELARILQVDPTNLSRELARLEAQGIFFSEVRGRQKQYRINKQYPFYKELRRLLQSEIGPASELRSALRGIDNVEQAYLFGSFAKGTSGHASDLDLLIIGHPSLPALEREMHALEKRLGREVNYLTIAKSELRQRLKARDPFLSDIWKGKKEALL